MENMGIKPFKFNPNASPTNSGYQIELFLNSKDAERYLCAICQCVFQQPYNIGCDSEHVFCKACLDNYFIPSNSIKSCPTCRAQGLSKTGTKPSKFVERLVNSLSVKCIFEIEENKHQHECLWNGELSDLNSHISHACPLGNVICEYCDDYMKRYQLKQHNNICSEKPMSCNQCGQEIKRRLLDRHSNNKCPMNMLSCDECKENILRKNMEQHLLIFCAQHEIQCIFQQYGCNFRVRRTLMDNHLREKEMKHLKMKVNIIENELKKQVTLNTSNMTWNEFVSTQEQNEILNAKQCIISYINGHDIIYENNNNNIYVNVLDMGMKYILKTKKIFKDTQFKEVFENWSEESGIKIENLMVYNYTERKNKTLRPNRKIKFDLNENNNKNVWLYLEHVIDKHDTPTDARKKYIKSICDRIGDIQIKKRMFILFDKTKVEYLFDKTTGTHANDGKNILIALKYFDIFEQKLYFIDWLLIKTNNIQINDVMKYIEMKLIVDTKDKRNYFNILYNYLKDMNEWEINTGEKYHRFDVYEEEVVLRNDNICKVNELKLDDVITDEYFDGDMFVFQLSSSHPYININAYEERGMYWYDNLFSFLESQLNMTWIELNVRENTNWKQRWTHALISQYKKNNNIPVNESINQEINKKICQSKFKWYVEKRITYGMIRKKLGYYYNINPNYIEIWLPQHNKWDYGSNGRGKWNDKLSNGKDKFNCNEIYPLKFEIQTYEMKDFDDMILYNESNSKSNISERIKQLAMFNFEIIAPNKAQSDCDNGNMTISFCKNWTAMNIIDNILKKMIENPIFGYRFFSEIVKYIRDNEMDSDKYIDDITILKSLSVDRFLICDVYDNKLPSQYYMNKQYTMPAFFLQIKYTDFRLQFLTKNDPLILNQKRNYANESKIDLNDNKALWFYINETNLYGQKKTKKIRIVIENGQSLKDVIMRYLKPFLKIHKDNNNNNNNEKSNNDILFQQICKTHKFDMKGATSKWEKNLLENVELVEQSNFEKMYMEINLPIN